MRWGSWRPYVPVAQRRVQAQKKMEKLRKKGLDVQPVEIEGRKIAQTFWGQAWCEHLESFSDYANRLPRGRSYVRNGSVCHLEIARGEIKAVVSGSELYNVRITIKTLADKKWQGIKGFCAGQIGSLLELLQGRLSDNVMTVVTDRQKGLFPLPGEISLHCSCPDWAVMCKHVAAVLYGVGARRDSRPELLFQLRGVDHEELISAEADVAAATSGRGQRRRIADDAVADVFGIEVSAAGDSSPAKPEPKRGKAAPAADKKPPAASKRSRRRKAKRAADNSVTASAAGKRVGSGKQKKRAAPQRSRVTQPPTGADVAALRSKFGMSQSQFARLLGVSAPSVANWEKNPAPLNLQPRSLDAWKRARKLSKRRAWQEMPSR